MLGASFCLIEPFYVSVSGYGVFLWRETPYGKRLLALSLE